MSAFDPARLFNNDGSVDREMLDIMARAGFKESNDADMEKALELTRAGWMPEIQEHHTPHPFTGSVAVMSWYWRRPPHKAGVKGRLFRSTDQAYNAMLKQA